MLITGCVSLHTFLHGHKIIYKLVIVPKRNNLLSYIKVYQGHPAHCRTPINKELYIYIYIVQNQCCYIYKGLLRSPSLVVPKGESPHYYYFPNGQDFEHERSVETFLYRLVYQWWQKGFGGKSLEPSSSLSFTVISSEKSRVSHTLLCSNGIFYLFSHIHWHILRRY